MRISLAEAFEQHRAGGVLPYSYSSYRKDAHDRGAIMIGETSVPVVKHGRSWTVDAKDFAAAVARAAEARRKQEQARERADSEYEARRLDPSGYARTTWGGYRVRDGFHFVWSDMDIMRQRSDGGWRCNTCWETASRENNKPECHRCSDWRPCGTDCTLSRIYCETCGTSLEM